MKLSTEKMLVVVGRAVDALGSIVFLKLLASLASKGDVGTYLLASSFLAVVLTVSFSALDQGFLRNTFDYSQKGELAARYSATLVSYLVLAVLISLLGSVVLHAGHLALALHPVLLPLFLWFTFESLKNFNIAVASASRSRGLIVLASVGDYGCRISLLVLAFYQHTLTVASILFLLSLASATSLSVYLAGQRKLLASFQWQVVRQTLRDSIQFAWPMMIWGFFGWLQNMSNRWLLSHFVDLQSVAEYGVLVSIASFPVTALMGLVVTYIQPVLYEREAQQPGSSFRIVKKVAWMLVPFCLLMVLVTTWFHVEIVSLLAARDYAQHSYMLPIILAVVCFSAVCSILSYAMFAGRKTSALLMANILPGVVCVLTGFYLVRNFGFNGAVFSLILSNVISGALFILTFTLIGKRKLKV